MYEQFRFSLVNTHTYSQDLSTVRLSIQSICFLNYILSLFLYRHFYFIKSEAIIPEAYACGDTSGLVYTLSRRDSRFTVKDVATMGLPCTDRPVRVSISITHTCDMWASILAAYETQLSKSASR